MKHTNKSSLYIIGSLTITTLISGLVLSSALASADDDTSVVDEINITVPVSCTLSGTGMNTHNANINNGQYNSAIGETTLKAFCNDNNGFAIYAIGYTDNEDGKNVLTNSTLGSTYDIETGTAITGNDSQWAMKLSTVTSPTPTYPIIIAGSTDDTDKEQGDPDYSTFQEVPDDYALVAKRTAGTDIGTNAEGATLKSTYQAYISKTQPAGTYTGQVKYTLVHPSDGLNPGIKTIANATTMQEVIMCPADLPEEQIYTLTDTRDNQDYKVAKLKDGKCWMVENLNIAGSTALSSEDTDFDSNYTLPTTDGWTVTDGKLILPASAIKNSADNNLTDNTQFSTDNYAYVFNSGNKENCSDNQNNPCYSYYSWDTATLGSGRLLNADNIDAEYSLCPKGWRLPTSGSDTNEGWKRGDFYTLAKTYGANLEESYYDSSSTTSIDFFNYAGYGTVPNYTIIGYYAYGAYTSGTSSVGFWSSTSASSYYYPYTESRLFNLQNWDTDEYSVNVSQTYNGRKYGYSIRCLLKTN